LGGIVVKMNSDQWVERGGRGERAGGIVGEGLMGKGFPSPFPLFTFPAGQIAILFRQRNANAQSELLPLERRMNCSGVEIFSTCNGWTQSAVTISYLRYLRHRVSSAMAVWKFLQG